MKLRDYLLIEDSNDILDYKKTIFDLRTAVGELEYQEAQTPPTERDRKVAYYEKIKLLKEKIVKLKQSILKQSQELGESLKPALKELLDKIPDPVEDKVEEGVWSSLFGGSSKEQAKKLKLDMVRSKLKDGTKIEDWDRDLIVDYLSDTFGYTKLVTQLQGSSHIDYKTRLKLLKYLN